MFNDYDLKLINQILTKYKTWYNKCIKKALTYKITSISNTYTEAKVVKNKKETIHKFFPVGIYNEDKQEFKYIKGINKIILKNILERYDIKNIFGSELTIKKLFKNTVKISHDYHTVIPCLLAIFNPAFSVINNQIENLKIYSFIQLNIKCDLDYDKFIDDMSIVKKFS